MAILPDDGTDRHLLRALRRDRGIARADSVAVRSVALLRAARSRRGHLPEAELARLVTVIVDAGEAGAVFEFIHAVAKIDRPGGGLLMMDALSGALPFALPEGVPDERD
jgi:hypothetical protein